MTAYTLGHVLSIDGISYRVDAINTDGSIRVRTQVGGSAPPVVGGPSLITSGDDLILMVVKSYGANTPPAHIAGERHIVGPAPTGAWANQPLMVAESDGLVWSFIEPWPGLHTRVTATTTIYTWAVTEWLIGNTTSTVTNAVSLPDGDYGDFTVLAGIASIKAAALTGPELGPLTDLTAPQIAALKSAIGSTGPSSFGTIGFDRYDPVGIASMTGPLQTATMADLVSIPRLPSEGRIHVEINVNQTIRSDDIELQLSFDGGNTWPRTADNRSGIPGEDTLLHPGSHVMQFKPHGSVNDDDEYLWFEVAPRPQATGLRYRFEMGFYDLETAGPIAVRLASLSSMPAAAVVTLTGVHFK